MHQPDKGTSHHSLRKGETTDLQLHLHNIALLRYQWEQLHQEQSNVIKTCP